MNWSFGVSTKIASRRPVWEFKRSVVPEVDVRLLTPDVAIADEGDIVWVSWFLSLDTAERVAVKKLLARGVSVNAENFESCLLEETATENLAP